MMTEQMALALPRPKAKQPLALPTEWPPRLRFDVDDAERAGDRWGFSCGPAALCALLGLTPDQLRQHLDRHSRKRSYMTPDDARRALASCGVEYSVRNWGWPRYGMARIQWGGPWLQPGVPYQARYCYTHWVASCAKPAQDAAPSPHKALGIKVPLCRPVMVQVYDINATCVGWLPLQQWAEQLVPWLLKEAVPRADGTWSITHTIEVQR